MVDREPAMLARAAAKGLATLIDDVQSLPVPDECADAVMLVSMLHPEELRAGPERLRADVEAGRAPREPGVASVLVCSKPG